MADNPSIDLGDQREFGVEPGTVAEQADNQGFG